jgi:hypothetical protein
LPACANRWFRVFAPMNTDSYNEAEVLERYLADNLYLLMTDFERRSLELAIKRKKATATESVADRLPKWLAGESEDVRRASLVDPGTIRERIKERVNRDLRDGTAVVNRCPRCQRIVRTPLARQCLWCGYDWHRL